MFQDVEHSKEIISISINGVVGNHVGTSSKPVDLAKKSPGQSGKSHQKYGIGLATGSKTGMTREGNHRFPESEGQFVFTLVFEDDDKKWVLETYTGLRSNAVVSCVVSNILLPANLENKDDMTCSELNQYVGGSEYKVSTFFELISLSNC